MNFFSSLLLKKMSKDFSNIFKQLPYKDQEKFSLEKLIPEIMEILNYNETTFNKIFSAEDLDLQLEFTNFFILKYEKIKLEYKKLKLISKLDVIIML